MSLSDLLTDLRRDPGFMANVVAWRTQHARAAQHASIPDGLQPLLVAALRERGISELYTHQAAAVELALAGRNVAVVTPTASGKTLCYNLPVLHSVLNDTESRALYLFPTKALAQDQLAELGAFRAAIDSLKAKTESGELLPGRSTSATSAPTPVMFERTIATYDGDTPSADRASIRRNARIVLSNPDMLHTGILPYHGNWTEFFAGLRYVVLDEMHVYRGVFGSHVGNVLRRLARVCRFYGSAPQFILTSATIANPQELAERLTERPINVIDENGAPQGEKQFILYNPPIYDTDRGLRRSSTLEAQELAARCVTAAVQTIVFGRSRLTTELLLSYLRDRLARSADRASNPDLQATIRGYRGGYLPTERRAIESGLRSGKVRVVVATNALELGIDIGQLQAAILCGYPGSIAATRQQMGRAGRTREVALALLVATGGALDQYVIRHPEYIFDRSPEHALINPDNLMLLVDQMRCAAFELPFLEEERFGDSTTGKAVLDLLAEQGDVLKAGQRYMWSGAGYPASMVSLRNAGSDNIAIEVHGGTGSQVIGEVDWASAPLLVHQGAVYIHEGQSHLVERLDLEQRLAVVVPTNVDFYTDVTVETSVDVRTTHDDRGVTGARVAHGELIVTAQVVGYRRIKRFSHETLGVFPLDYEPATLETTGYWLGIMPEAQLSLARRGQWFDSVNDYGPNWQAQRQRVRERDAHRCSQCGAPEAPQQQHDVHHLIPFRTFGFVAGVNDHYRQANMLDNLTLVCRSCHRRLESSVRVRTGLDGLSYALGNLAPLHLMCDRSDLGVTVVRGDARIHDAGETGQAATDGAPKVAEIASASPVRLPTIYIYERIAAGLGFSARLFELHEELLMAAASLVDGCACPHGCPACVGPVLEHEHAQLATKELTRVLLNLLCDDSAPVVPKSSALSPHPTSGDTRDVRF